MYTYLHICTQTHIHVHYCVLTHVYIHVHTHTHTYVYICTYVFMHYVCVHVCVCVCVSMQMKEWNYVSGIHDGCRIRILLIHTYILYVFTHILYVCIGSPWRRIHTHIHIYMYTCIFMYTCIYIHAHTQTRTRTHTFILHANMHTWSIHLHYALHTCTVMMLMYQRNRYAHAGCIGVRISLKVVLTLPTGRTYWPYARDGFGSVDKQIWPYTITCAWAVVIWLVKIWLTKTTGWCPFSEGPRSRKINPLCIEHIGRIGCISEHGSATECWDVHWPFSLYCQGRILIKAWWV